jgi:hypothetical protein
MLVGAVFDSAPQASTTLMAEFVFRNSKTNSSARSATTVRSASHAVPHDLPVQQTFSV